MATFVEPNDTLIAATVTGINGIGTASFSGSIGDNPSIAPGLDVDIFELQLNADEFLTVDIDADVIGSSLDSYLRLFDASGNQLAANDDAGGSDSALSLVVPTTGTYYIELADFAFADLSFFQGTGDVAADAFGFVGGEAVLQVANTTVAELDSNANFV